ncbi:hypothetical protein [Rufibacter roseus]|uniref:DUF7832 domain-containing protein n=1 Tax=Rufibacter roseus TaxID=1567108 RepID=A0ABW2DRV6_9BACT|nr:hypothetical protein [Rufibacter roseus]
MNQLYLIKENRITTDFVKLEAEGKLLYISKGKVGKTVVAKITRGCGSDEKALAELEQTAEQYLGKGYRIGKESPKDVRETVSYDKAKWHLGGDFPEGLDDYQAYVHTGLYINWIIDNDLSSNLLLQEYPDEIRRVKEKIITGQGSTLSTWTEFSRQMNSTRLGQTSHPTTSTSRKANTFLIWRQRLQRSCLHFIM